MFGSNEFYDCGLGDRLVNSILYPACIVDFLRLEKLILSKNERSFNSLIEVGCMNGRYLSWALNYKKSYVGIDVVARYLRDGRRRVREQKLSPRRFRFLNLAAQNLAESRAVFCDTNSKDGLIFFPFNSIGNMVGVEDVIAALGKLKMTFFISTYSTKECANRCRLEYYNRCDYGDIAMLEDERGVCFRSDEGLTTIAYHDEYLMNIFTRCEIPVRRFAFASIGVAYCGFGEIHLF